MTFENDQIQALIAEIDGVLRKASPRLPWVMSADVAQQRRVLERVRSYLVSLQPLSAVDKTFPLSRTKGGMQPSGPTRLEPLSHPASSAVGNLNQQILQSIVQDLRSSVTEPLQADVKALRQQREDLLYEIKQLEQQRQQFQTRQQASQQEMVTELLQVLMERLQESLRQQVVQSLADVGPGFGNSPLGDEAKSWGSPSERAALGAPTAANLPLLTPKERLEQLQRLQAQSDRLLMTLDSSISVVFEALQRNLYSYQESLSQGIDKMYGLGQQSEVMFKALVNSLASQLGRETSSFLQSRQDEEASVKLDAGSTGKSLRPSGKERSEPVVPGSSEPGSDRQPTAPEEVSGSDPVSIAQQLDAHATETLQAGNASAAAASEREEETPETDTRDLDDSPPPAELDATLELLELLDAEAGAIAPPPPSPSPIREEDSKKTAVRRQVGDLPAADRGSGDALSDDAESDPDLEAVEGLYDALFGSDELAIDSTAEAATAARESETDGRTAERQAVTESFLSESEVEARESSIATESEIGSLETAIEEDLFGTPEQPNAESGIESTELQQGESLEDWFFGEPPVGETLRKRAVEVSGDGETAPLEADPEAISTFDDLFGMAEDFQQAPATGEADGTRLDDNVMPTGQQPGQTTASASNYPQDSDDVYIPASPEESLLPTNEPEEVSESDFSLDSTTLQQLSEDLSSLENWDNDSSESSDLTLAEWGQQLESEASEGIDAGALRNNLAREERPVDSGTQQPDLGLETADERSRGETAPHRTRERTFGLEQATTPETLESADDILSEALDRATVEPVEKKEVSKRRDVDTQNMTLDEAFVDFAADPKPPSVGETGSPQPRDRKRPMERAIANSSESAIQSPTDLSSSHPMVNEKKKRFES